MHKANDLISRSHLLERCEKLRDEAYSRLKGVALDSGLRTTLIIEKDERDRLCEMIHSEPSAQLHEHIFAAKRRYEGDRRLIIFAKDREEAEEKAKKFFGLSSVSVSPLAPASSAYCADDPEVFEI